MRAAVLAGRRAAERLMTAECVVRRATGEHVTDSESLKVVPVFDTVYEGRCKPTTYDAFERTPESAGATLTVQRSRLDLPVGGFAPKVGDIVTITSSADPLMVGRSYRVVQEVPVKEHATAYRVFVDENVGEEVPPWQG